MKKDIEELAMKSPVTIEERGNVKGERQTALKDPCVMKKRKDQPQAYHGKKMVLVVVSGCRILAY